MLSTLFSSQSFSLQILGSYPFASLTPPMAACEGEFVLDGTELSDQEREEDDDLPSIKIPDNVQLNSHKKQHLSDDRDYFQLLPENEKQISVDPVSLKHPPPVLPPHIRPQFVSSSLPSSTTSSPQNASSLPKSFQKWMNSAQKPHPIFHSLAHQHCAALSQFPLQMPLRRSKSCGEGRSSQPCDEFDIMLRIPSHVSTSIQKGAHMLSEHGSNYQEVHKVQVPCNKEEEEFKCGVLCLFLKTKKKQVQFHLQDNQDYNDNNYEDESEPELEEEHRNVISRAASLEKFECASWSSAAILDCNEDYRGGSNSYFDLPLELIRGGRDDAHSPVKAAFVFEKDRKGVLKTSTSRMGPRKSYESSSNRHVRFSTSVPPSYPSSPTSACITPRLLRAREEFNALLEAQSAYINF